MSHMYVPISGNSRLVDNAEKKKSAPPIAEIERPKENRSSDSLSDHVNIVNPTYQLTAPTKQAFRRPILRARETNAKLERRGGVVRVTGLTTSQEITPPRSLRRLCIEKWHRWPAAERRTVGHCPGRHNVHGRHRRPAAPASMH